MENFKTLIWGKSGFCVPGDGSFNPNCLCFQVHPLLVASQNRGRLEVF